jgi:dihydrofolate reductase
MRRIVMFNQVSADGYFAAPDGNLDWVVHEPEIERGATENLQGPGTVLFGRRTYEMFAWFWPRAIAEAGAKSPHGGTPLSAAQRAMGHWLDAATKIVFSRTMQDAPWRNTQLRSELDPAGISALKQEPGSDIMIFGSGSVVSHLTEHGLIDEYQLVVSPVMLGGGRKLIEGVTDRSAMKLLEARSHPTGSVMLRYAPAA